MKEIAPQTHRFLDALSRKPVDRPPVWMMRQAGRYLPEYRALRQQQSDFLLFCKTPELCCEAVMQPLERYGLDAAILFSDILTVPNAMGMNLKFVEGVGPVFPEPLASTRDVELLLQPDVEEDLFYVMDAVRMTKQALSNKVPLIGFSGSPWTLACYMVEGQGSKQFSKIKRLLYSAPEVLHELLNRLSSVIEQYLIAQVRAGADVVMLFDTWGGLLSTPDYHAFSLAYMQRILKAVKEFSPSQDVPVILFTKGGALWLESMAETGCDALGIDWTLPMSEAKRRVGDRVALQGNLDPCVLYGTEERIRQGVTELKAAYGNDPGLIVNLGHGILPDVPPEHVNIFVDAVHHWNT